MFGSSRDISTQEVIPIEDIRFENYAQKNLRAFNVSAIVGLEIRRNFGDRVEFYTKPSAQYFTKSFYKRGGFEDVKWAYHINFEFNYLLTVYAEQ